MATLKIDAPPLQPAPLLSSSRRTTRIVLLVLLVISVFTYLRRSPTSPQYRPQTFKSPSSTSHPDPYSKAAQQFWTDYSEALFAARPTGKNVTLKMDAPWLTFDRDKPEHRFDFVDWPEQEMEEMKTMHQGMVKAIRKLGWQIPFKRGTRGIAASAGNDGLTYFTTSLRILRMTGSTLPVEVFIDKYEYAPCEIIFPSLGARCVFLSDVLPSDMPHPFNVSHFGFKSAAVAFSSFEHVLYMDSDLFPVQNPDTLFHQEPFTSTGLVLWPDYWASTTNHRFYDIAGIGTPWMDERASTESGAILINKALHARTALMSFYYNQHGRGWYYQLLSQGAPGMGDKETWLNAARVMDLPFYQVEEPPTRMGYRCGGKLRSVASAQHHPYEDWLNVKLGARHASKGDHIRDIGEPPIMFVHGNLPKYDVPFVLDWRVGDWEDLLECEGQAHRFWGPKEFTLRRFGWDVEKAVWDSMRWTACEHEFDYAMWTNGTWHSGPKEDVCKRWVEHYAKVMGNGSYDPSLRVPKKVWPHLPP